MVDEQISLRQHFEEIIAQQRDHYEALLGERDARYAERDTANKEAVRAALAAAEKAVDAALSASKEDANKTAESLKEYKSSANEWRSTVQSLVDRMPSNTEVDRRFGEQDAKIRDLTSSRDTAVGKGIGGSTLLAYIVAAVSVVGAIIAMFIKLKGG